MVRRCVVRCATVAMIVSGCGATVRSTVAADADLSRYKSYAFDEPAHGTDRATSRAARELRSALRNDLFAKGLTEAAPGEQPDFLIVYRVTRPRTRGGTLLVQFLDPRTHQRFWRGSAADVVRDLDAPNVTALDRAVARLVGRYPASIAATSRPTL